MSTNGIQKFIAIHTAIYLAFCVAGQGFNPFAWSEVVRAFYCIIVCVSVLFAVTVFSNNLK